VKVTIVNVGRNKRSDSEAFPAPGELPETAGVVALFRPTELDFHLGVSRLSEITVEVSGSEPQRHQHGERQNVGVRSSPQPTGWPK